MTVESSVAKSGPYAGAGLAGPFPVTFRFLDNSHLQIVQATGLVQNTLTLNVDYTVTGAGASAGGTVTLTTVLPFGQTLTINRNVPITQLTDYVQSDSFPAQSHEDALDKLTMIDQQLAASINGAIRVPETVSTLPALPPAAARAGLSLVFDAFGNPTVAAALPTGTQFQFGVPYNDQFTPNGGVNYALTTSPGLLRNLDVWVGGVKQRNGIDFTWSVASPMILTSSVAWPTDATVEVEYTQALPVGVSDASVVNYSPSITYPVGSIGRKASERISAKDFGAKGDGVTDDTTAIDKLFAFCNTQAADYISNPPDFFKTGVAKAYFPRGDYVYNGAGFSPGYIMFAIEGEDKSTTRLKITSSVYLVTATSGVMFFGTSGMHVYGGKGIFAGTFTASNTLAQVVVEDNIFFNYTECAIGHLSQDFPHWKIRRNQFHGALSSGERISFGVVLSGRADGCQIEDNEFQENKVGVKLAVATNGTVASIVANNVFERWSTSPGSLASVGLWVVPTTPAPTVSGGGGVATLVNTNRFGNENLLATDYHILIAEENTGAGTSALNYLPSFSASAKFLGGMRFADNTFYGTGASSSPMVFSTTPNIWACKFENTSNATPIATISIMPGAVTDLGNSQYSTNVFRQLHVGGPSYFLPAPASIYMGPVEDPISLFQSWNNVPTYWRTGYDAAVSELTTQFVASYTLGTASLANVTDAAGGNEAVEMTVSALNGFMATATSVLTQGRLGFVSFDIKAGSSLPLPYIRVAFTDNSGTTNPIVDRLVGVNAQWRRVTIPFCMNAASAVNTLQFQATAYAAGVNTKVQIGRVRVYHAQEAVHPYTKALDSGLVSYTIGPVTAGQTVTPGNVTVTGAAPGDFCLAVYGATLNGMIVTAEVISANTVKVYVYNPSGGTITPAVNGLRIRVLKAV